MGIDVNRIVRNAEAQKKEQAPAISRQAQIVVNNGTGRVNLPVGTDTSKLTKESVQKIVATSPVQAVQTTKAPLPAATPITQPEVIPLSQRVKISQTQPTPAVPTAETNTGLKGAEWQRETLDQMMRDGQQNDPNLIKRITSILDASAKKGQGNFETLWESVGNWAGDKLMDLPVVGDWLEEQLAKPENAYLRESKTPLPYKTSKEIAYETAERDIARAKEGLGKTGQAAVDLASSISDMGFNIAASAATGIPARAFNTASSAASAIEQAKADGSTDDEALAYGALRGGLSYAIDKLSGGIPGFGKGFADDMIAKVSSKIAKNPAGANLVKRAFDVLGEGAEEALETAIDPLLQRLTYDENADFATGEDLLYSAVMGALASAVFNAPGAVADTVNAAKTALPRKNTAANVQAQPAQDDILPRANAQTEAVTDADAETDTEPGFFGAEVDAESDPSAEAKAHMQNLTPNLLPKKVEHTKEWEEAAYQAKQAGERLGVKVEIVSDLPNGVAGEYRDGVIRISDAAENPLKSTFVHELTHHLEATNTYNTLRDYVVERAASGLAKDGKTIDDYRQQIKDGYAKKGKTIDDAGADAEIVANYIEQKLFNNSKEIARLANKHRGLVQVIRDWFTDLRVKFRGTAQEKELLRAQRLFEKALRETNVEGYRTSRDGQYSFAGENAKTADLALLERAKQMQTAGADASTILRDTGWYVGRDGKWRFEIDDSSMQYYRGGDATFRRDHPEYAEYQGLMGKMLDGSISADEYTRMMELHGTWGGEYKRLSDRVAQGNARLPDIIDHPALFAAYPDLKYVRVGFSALENGEMAKYNPLALRLTINEKLKNAPEKTLLHEIQHAIQQTENFSSGASPEYWADYLGAEATDKNGRTPFDLYWNTSGEIEARDAADRIKLTAEERRAQMPDLGDEGTVFADKAGEAYSYIGKTKDGVPVYKSDFEDTVSEAKRKQLFENRIATIFNLGAVKLNTDTKKIEVLGDKFTFDKNLYGDDYATDKEFSAKINALYDMADILSNSTFVGKNAENSYVNNVPPKNKAHKNVKYWYKFKNEIVLDGSRYDVVFNIRDKGKDQYAYLIEFREKETPANSNTATKNSLLRTKQVSLDSRVPQTKPSVKTSVQNSIEIEGDLLRASSGRTAEEVRAETKAAVEQYGAMRENKQPGVREATYPHETAQGKTMHTAQTIGGSNLVDDRMELNIEEAILDGKFAYEVSGDKEAIQSANEKIEGGNYDVLSEQAKGLFADGYRLKKEQVVFVERMIQEASKKGDVDTAMSLIADLAAYGTEQGQNIQALSMIRRMTPEGKLMVLKRQVDKANQITQVDSESKGEIKKAEREIKEIKREAFSGLEDIGVDEDMDIETAQRTVDEAIAEKEKELVPFMPEELYTSNPQRDKSYSDVDKVTSEVIDALKNVGQIDAPKQKEQVENVVKRLKKQRLRTQLDEDLLELQKITREIASLNKHIRKVEVLPTKESIDAERAERKAKLERRQKQLEERIAQLRKLSEREDLLGTLAYEDIILRQKDDFLTADYREAKQFEYQKERLDKAITTLEEFLKTGEETVKDGPTAAERAEQKRKRLELIAERDDELGKKAKEVIKAEDRKKSLESEKKTLEKINREIETLNKSIEQKSILPDADSIKKERADRKAALEKQKENAQHRITELETLAKRDDLIGKKAREDIELHLKEEAARADYKTAKQLELQKERLNSTIEELSKLKTDADIDAKKQENELKRKAKQDDLVRLSERKDEIGKKAREILALQKRKAELAEAQKRVTELKNAAKKINESVVLPKETIEAMLKAKSPSEQNDLYNKALDEIASQIVSSLPDKANAWRYLAMLGNPRTHIRNMTGNATMYVTNAAKNIVKYGIESLPGVKRTTALKASKEAKAFAKEDFELNRDLITGGGKMNASDELRDRMTIFKNKGLEAFRKFNTAAMEAEDEFFMRKAYESSLARYITAKKKSKEFLESGSTAAESFLAKARAHAIREAREVTFHDDSALADWLSGITRTAKDEKASTKVAKAMVEGALPFKKTPINVAKRGIEYSPISVATALNKFSKGDAAGAIDDLAKGATGTIMMAVGLALAHFGMLRTKNEEKDEVLDTQENEQNYSLRWPNKDGTVTSFSLDALMPAAMPLLVGVEVNKLLKEEDMSVMSVLESLTGIADPIVENSMLDGLNDMLTYVGYSDTALGAIFADMGESYVEQFRPSILRQIQQSIDPTVRTTYTPKDSPIGKGVETHLRSLANATPVLPWAAEKLDEATGSDRFSLQPKIDVWGNEVKKADSFGARLVQNMVLPFNVKKVTSDPVNEELRRLYHVDSTYSVLPKVADKSYEYKNDRYYPTPAEYTELAKEKGQTSKEFLNKTIKDAGYKALPDAKKADVVSNLLMYANYKAKQDFFDGRGINYVTDTFNGVEKAVARGLTAEEYYIMKAQMDGGQTAEEKIPYYMDMLTNDQKQFISRLPKDAASASWLERIALSNQGESAKVTSAFDDILIGEKKEKVDYSDKASIYLSLIDGNANSKIGDKYYEYAQPAGVSVEDYMIAYFAQKDVTYPAKTKGAKAAAEKEAIDKALPNLSRKQREALYQAFKG